MFLGFINRKSNTNSNQTNEIELIQTNSSINSNNDHIYEEILDYYDNKDIQIVNESATLSTRKKCVRFKSNQNNQCGHFTDLTSLPLNTTTTASPSILMPILRIDPMLKNTNTMFSSSISSTSSASSSSSSSSCIYTTSSSLTSNNSSSHSIAFNQMVEDFLSHCTLKLNKSNKQDDNESSSYNSKSKLKNKKKQSVLNTSTQSNTSTMSSNSSNTMNSNHYKCCCQQHNQSNTINTAELDKLSYRVTNLTLEDLKKRQKLIYNHQKSLNNSNLFSTIKQS